MVNLRDFPLNDSYLVNRKSILLQLYFYAKLLHILQRKKVIREIGYVFNSNNIHLFLIAVRIGVSCMRKKSILKLFGGIFEFAFFGINLPIIKCWKLSRREVFMIEVYYAGNTNSGRKTMEWLEKQNLPFIEKKITKNNPFKIEEIMQFLARAENGFDDLINSRAKIFKELEADLNQLSTSDLIDTIVRIPTLVKLPLIVDEKKIVIGYNENELRCFLPAEYRRIQRDSYLFIKKIRV